MRKKGEAIPQRLSGQEGMMTVEVSVLVPILLFLMAAILFFQFFMIDMAAAHSLAMKGAGEAAASWKTGGDLLTKDFRSDRLLDRETDYLISGRGDRYIADRMKARIASASEERWILVLSRSSQSSLSDSIACSSQQLFFKIPLSGSSFYTGIGGWKFTCRQAAAVDDWEENLRRELNGYE